jgi:hypothetical protein
MALPANVEVEADIVRCVRVQSVARRASITRFLGARGEDQNLRRGRDVVFYGIRTRCMYIYLAEFFQGCSSVVF